MYPRFVAEDALGEHNDQRIRKLLIAAFPSQVQFFSEHSYWGIPPHYRLWLENAQGAMLAHLACGRRQIAGGTTEIDIAGIGCAATHPTCRGKVSEGDYFINFEQCSAPSSQSHLGSSNVTKPWQVSTRRLDLCACINQFVPLVLI